MFLCMRTTIHLNDELFREAKKRAAHDGVPLRALIEAALRRYLANRGGRRAYSLRWRVERGRLRVPAEALEDRQRLLDLMDGRS